jgi:hypothetical protein
LAWSRGKQVASQRKPNQGKVVQIKGEMISEAAEKPLARINPETKGT